MLARFLARSLPPSLPPSLTPSLPRSLLPSLSVSASQDSFRHPAFRRRRERAGVGVDMTPRACRLWPAEPVVDRASTRACRCPSPACRRNPGGLRDSDEGLGVGGGALLRRSRSARRRQTRAGSTRPFRRAAAARGPGDAAGPGTARRRRGGRAASAVGGRGLFYSGAPNAYSLSLPRRFLGGGVAAAGRTGPTRTRI